jgi:hypothetical protein
MRYRFRDKAFAGQVLQIQRTPESGWEDADSLTAALAADILNGEVITL